MIAVYTEAVYRALGSVLTLLVRLALPLAIGGGLIVLAAALIQAFGREPERCWSSRALTRTVAYGPVVLLIVASWGALSVILPTARTGIAWRESAEATANPVPDAPAVTQYGPSLAVLAEKTYTRTLTLPPNFVERLGNEGIGVLAPYLSDPTADNVLRLVDTFRRSGENVVFSRDLTRLDEDPLPFTDSQVTVRFRRLPGRAYESTFSGRYTFENHGVAPVQVRFTFSLPQANTIRALQIQVSGATIHEPGRSGAYEWQGTLAPGERKEASVGYTTIGARTWGYDLGSQRRRVHRFSLVAETGGPVRFLRGSLQPTRTQNDRLSWEMTDLVTAQQVALAFPPDTVGRDGYLQALSALPTALVSFVVGVVLTGLLGGRRVPPRALALATVLFVLGLGSAAVLANYLGFIAGVLIGPLIGATLAVRVLGSFSLLAVLPAALLPAVFLSPRHSGLLVLLLAAVALAPLVARRPISPSDR
jgi:hypothetical protein